MHKKSSVILHNKKSGNNFQVAKLIQEKLICECFAAEDDPNIEEFGTIIIVASNMGDEEISQPMEDYLFALKTQNKQYFVCELGNYFGLEEYCGCKKAIFQILDKLNWTKLSDISLDSFPELDIEKLEIWIKNALLDDGK
jgi:flavodoxin